MIFRQWAGGPHGVSDGCPVGQALAEFAFEGSGSVRASKAEGLRR